ncbi:MAG: dihydroneopterin aldolase [Pseudomonadota bacterium]
MDTIFLQELEIETIIGIYDWEREVKQTVSIDLEMPVDAAKAAATDDVADSVNYKAVAKAVIGLVEPAGYQLIETMAEEIAQLILREHGVNWVRVSVSKPGAIRGSRNVGIRIERHAQ